MIAFGAGPKKLGQHSAKYNKKSAAQYRQLDWLWTVSDKLKIPVLKISYATILKL